MPEWENKEEPAILIGLRAIHSKVEAIDDCVQKIKATMEAQSHEERLRLVERRVYQMPTFSIIISLAAAIVAIVSVAKGLGMKKKFELKNRRKTYLILAILVPLLIAAGWVSEDWAEAIMSIAAIVLGFGGPSIAAHFSKEPIAAEPPEDAS